jgi:hypothetical protein
MGDSLLSELFKDLMSLFTVTGGAVLVLTEVVTPVLVCIGLISQIVLTVYRINKVRTGKAEDVE